MNKVYIVNIEFRVKMSPFHRTAHTSIRAERIIVCNPEKVKEKALEMLNKVSKIHEVNYYSVWERDGHFVTSQHLFPKDKNHA